MGERTYISDLYHPLYSDAQQAALEYGASLEVELRPGSIMAEAERRTGLGDWGATDFLVRLQLLCDEWSADAELTGAGRLGLRNKLVQHASSRLLIREQLRRHPQIHDIQIRRPVIVAGLPRSGTTHLLNLMAARRTPRPTASRHAGAPRCRSNS